MVVGPTTVLLKKMGHAQRSLLNGVAAYAAAGALALK
jgi:hypothetical protein